MLELLQHFIGTKNWQQQQQPYGSTSTTSSSTLSTVSELLSPILSQLFSTTWTQTSTSVTAVNYNHNVNNNNSNNNNNSSALLMDDDYMVGRTSGFQTASTVIAWILTSVFLIDIVLVVAILVAVLVHLRRARYHTRLKSYLSRNRSFSFPHMIFIALCTCLPLALRSIRLLLNVHIRSEKNQSAAQSIYCRSSAWVWDLSLAALVFIYVSRCLYMAIRYTDKKKKVQEWNKGLKDKFKQYRMYFRERTHSLSTFLTPRSSSEFFRSSSKLVQKLKIRRNSRSSILIDSATPPVVIPSSPSQSPRTPHRYSLLALSVASVENDSPYLSSSLPSRLDTMASLATSPPVLSSSLGLKQQQQHNEFLLGSSLPKYSFPQPQPQPQQQQQVQHPFHYQTQQQQHQYGTVVPSPTMTGDDDDYEPSSSNNVTPVHEQTLTVSSGMGSSQALLLNTHHHHHHELMTDVEMNDLSPLSSTSPTSPHHTRPFTPTNYSTSTVPPQHQDATTNHDIASVSSTGGAPRLPSLNLGNVRSSVAADEDGDEKKKGLLKTILTTRKAKYGTPTREEYSLEMVQYDNQQQMQQQQQLGTGGMRGDGVNAPTLSSSYARDIDTNSDESDNEDDETGTETETERSHRVGGEAPNGTDQAPTPRNMASQERHAFHLDMARLSKNTKEEMNAISSARALFTEEELKEHGMHQEDRFYQDVEEEMGSATALAVGLQNTMTELLTISTTPQHMADKSIVKRLSLRATKRNNDMMALHNSILTGIPIADSNPSKTVVPESMNRRTQFLCCQLPKLSLGAKLGLASLTLTAIVFVVLAVLTGAIPWVYPGYAECSKDIFRSVYTYTDPIFYVHLAGIAFCVIIYLVLSIVLSSLKVYDLLTYELWGITIASLIVPISTALTPVIYAAGVSSRYSPIQHYVLNVVSFLWMLVFQIFGIVMPSVGLIYSLNTRDARDIVSTVKKPIAFFDPNAQTLQLEAMYTFDTVLTDKNLRDAFRKFLVKMLCPENLFFLDEVALYQQVDSASKRRELGADIIHRFIRNGSLYELNVSNFEKISMIEKYQRLNQECPKNLFKELESTIRFTLATDCYKKFIASKDMRDVLNSGVSITTANSSKQPSKQ